MFVSLMAHGDGTAWNSSLGPNQSRSRSSVCMLVGTDGLQESDPEVDHSQNILDFLNIQFIRVPSVLRHIC